MKERIGRLETGFKKVLEAIDSVDSTVTNIRERR